MENENLNYVYLFSDIQHFKRIKNFVKIKKKFLRNNFILVLPIRFENCNIIKPKIISANDSILNLEFLNYKELNSKKISKRFPNTKKFNIIIDKFLNQEEFILCSTFYRKRNFKIIFIEHNLYFCWDYIFSYNSGYKKQRLFNLLFSRNIYKIILITLFSNLKNRLLKRKINILNFMRLGLITLSDEIYLYDSKSLEYLEKFKCITNIKKQIIDYQFEFLPNRANIPNVFNTCIFSTGSFKGNNKKTKLKQIRALKYIINHLEGNFIGKNIKITIKFKSGSLEKFPILKYSFNKEINLVEDINYQSNKYDLVILPIDSFAVIEFLRSNIPIYTYNIYKNYGPIRKLIFKNKKISKNFNLSNI